MKKTELYNDMFNSLKGDIKHFTGKELSEKRLIELCEICFNHGYETGILESKK